jgi:proteic killer suppression protein
MIKSFKHKGLSNFFYKGTKKGIIPEHASKLARILDRLDASTSVQDMNLPGYKYHPLKGDREDVHSGSVNGNWRVTFYFKDGDAYIVNYEDYH